MNYGPRTMMVPPLSKINKVIIIVVAIFFVINSVLKNFSIFVLEQYLGLNINSFLEGHIYQLLTYPIISQEGLLAFVFNLMILWFIGSPLESSWGVRRYLGFIFTTVIGSGMVYLLLAYALLPKGYLLGSVTDIMGLTNALLIASAIINPNQLFYFMFFFPMPAKYFCLLIVAIQLYIGILTAGAVTAWVSLASMFFGVFYMWLVANKFFGIGEKRKSKAAKDRAKLQLVRGERDNNPRYWN